MDTSNASISIDDPSSLCRETSIEHNFSAFPQQNGITEKKNMKHVEATRTMFSEYFLLRYFWAEVVNTAFYVLNRVNIRYKLNKTLYKLLKGKTPIYLIYMYLVASALS